MKRLIAIVGRPNVGKSALFNRLARRRAAIVHEQSGVTRDRLIEPVVWRNQSFDLADTGGLAAPDRTRGEDFIHAGIRQQVEAALEDAAAIILVADIECGLTGSDQDVADWIRKTGRPAVLAVNKADSPEKDELAEEFNALALPVVPISALQNRGIDTLMSHVLPHLPEAETETGRAPLSVAVVGRPNVGKSSFINRIVRSDRVIVSNQPGTTRDSVDIPFTLGKGEQARRYVLIDTAGMRRSNKIDSAVERFGSFRAESSIRRADIVVHVLEAGRDPTAHDRKIAALVMRHRKGCLIVVNKWDLSEETQRQWGPTVAREMPFMGHCPIIFVSAKTGYNIRQSLEAMDYVGAQIRTELPTGMLNRVLLDLHAARSMPIVRGKRPRIFYATQTGYAPIRIRIFVNYPGSVPMPYRNYLVNGLRRAFGLEGAFVQLEFKARRETRPPSSTRSGAPSRGRPQTRKPRNPRKQKPPRKPRG